MPIIWRYLLISYFKIFSLCVTAFISVLLVMQFEDIARFASSGASPLNLFLFTMYQIPYILPLAIPISCLIASILLFQTLSRTHELTAFRACGMGIRRVSFPIIFAASFLSLCNFHITSELAPKSRALSKQLIYTMTSINPLLIFQKETLVKLKDMYVDMQSFENGKKAKDLIVVINNRSHGRLDLITAKHLSLQDEMLQGKQVTFISSLDPKRDDAFDHLIIENQASMHTKASNLSQFIHETSFYSSFDHLPLKLLLAKELFEKKGLTLSFDRGKVEIGRRLSLGLAPLTFTLIGLGFGMEVGRLQRKKGIFFAISLVAFFMICFLSGKSLRNHFTYSFLLFLTPHFILTLFSLRSLKKFSEGAE